MPPVYFRDLIFARRHPPLRSVLFTSCIYAYPKTSIVFKTGFPSGPTSRGVQYAPCVLTLTWSGVKHTTSVRVLSRFTGYEGLRNTVLGYLNRRKYFYPVFATSPVTTVIIPDPRRPCSSRLPREFPCSFKPVLIIESEVILSKPVFPELVRIIGLMYGLYVLYKLMKLSTYLCCYKRNCHTWNKYKTCKVETLWFLFKYKFWARHIQSRIHYIGSAGEGGSRKIQLEVLSIPRMAYMLAVKVG